MYVKVQTRHNPISECQPLYNAHNQTRRYHARDLIITERTNEERVEKEQETNICTIGGERLLYFMKT